MHSLAYRKHERDILEGKPPLKYTRLLPFVTGQRILEIGSAEGVLALLLAKAGKSVTAIEKNEERHSTALRLYAEWQAREQRFEPPCLVNGEIAQNLSLLRGIDTVVGVRVIYYLRDDLDTVFAEAAKHAKTIVLCGNKNRAARWRAGVPDEPGGPRNALAASEGMVELLTRHGYRITQVVSEGDEIVVGER